MNDLKALTILQSIWICTCVILRFCVLHFTSSRMTSAVKVSIRHIHNPRQFWKLSVASGWCQHIALLYMAHLYNYILTNTRVIHYKIIIMKSAFVYRRKWCSCDGKHGNNRRWEYYICKVIIFWVKYPAILELFCYMIWSKTS